MILEEFDAKETAVINPWDICQPKENFPKVCVTCFAKETFERLLKETQAVRIGSTSTANGEVPIYKTTFHGVEIGLFLSLVGAPSCVGDLEEIAVFGMEKLVMFGTCGVLEKEVGDCAIIIPDRAVRDEGTSYHYAPSSDEIEVNPRYQKEFLEILERHGCTYHSGKVWTTDAFYRETPKKVEQRKQQGCICVDMECSAVAAWAAFRGKEVFQFFYAADNLDGESWERRSLSNTENLLEKDVIAMIAMELAEQMMRETIPGMPANFRDLGGIQNREGRRVKRGRLLRCGELSQISEQAKEALEQQWKLRFVLDLRTEKERAAAPDQEVPGAVYQVLDFFAQDNETNVGSIEQFLRMQSEEEVHQYMEILYRAFVTSSSARGALRHFIDILLEMEEGAALFHCAAGKDRTGVSAAVILSILGVNREKIMEDYLLTNQMRQEANEMLLKQIRQQMEENKDKLPEGTSFEKIEPAIRAALCVNQRYLETTFAAAEEIYGSFAGFVKDGIGVTKQEQERLCSLYLE